MKWVNQSFINQEGRLLLPSKRKGINTGLIDENR